jgi:HEPN domain-containing protein
MNQEISAWVSKAEEDWRTMCRESKVTDEPSLNAVCFHAQQCVEKYFKARLRFAEIPFSKTHDLLILFEEIILVEPRWEMLRSGLGDLSAYAVALRYPGLDATHDQVTQSVEFCNTVRKLVRPSLGLSNDR